MLACLLIVFVLLGLGTLTVVEPPRWVDWRLAVLAGEFGHVLATAAAGLVVLTLWVNPPLGWGTVVIALSVLAAILLLKPVIQARWIARRLPAVFDAAFPGSTNRRGDVFSTKGLFGAQTRPVGVRTLVYAAGRELDFYPAAGGRVGPCVVFVHGGGWDAGDRRELQPVNQALAAAEYAVAAIDYRLAPAHRWPGQRDDILAALTYLKAHASELGLDPTRFVLAGRSAGGHLAEATAFTVPDPAIRGVIALYAPADLELAWTCGLPDKFLDSPCLMRQLLGQSYPEAVDEYRAASGYFHVGPQTPPTLLLHGRIDPLVWHRQSERLAEKLTAHGVPNVFVSLPWATHAFDYNTRGPGGQIALWSMLRFLDAVSVT